MYLCMHVYYLCMHLQVGIYVLIFVPTVPLASVSTVHLVTLLVSVFRSDQEGAQFNLPVWAAPLLLLLSLLYPLLSSFIFAYRHRKIRLEVLFMLGLSSGEITTHMK